MQKMLFSTNKKRIASISLILILTMSTLMMVLPFASGQSTMRSYAFIGAVPNPVGVGQEVLLHVGMLHALTAAEDGWENLTVTVTSPDGETEELGPFRTDSTGGTGWVIFPDQVGTWTLQTHFPEQEFEGVTYLADDSEVLELIVQEEPLEFYPGHSLPDQYWTRPIDSQLREWYGVSGSWLAKPPNLYAPYNDAPKSPHILWTRPIGDSMGGLVGGQFGEHGFGDGDAYEGKFPNPIVVGGVLFYNKIDGVFGADNREQYVVAVDLKTGEELWTKQFLDNARLAFGQELYWSSLNYHGAFSYLWVTVSEGWFGPTNWYAFEPLTGDLRITFNDVPGGDNYYGPNGEILKFSVNTQNAFMTQWNSSTVVHLNKTGMSESWGSQVTNTVYDAERGYDFNVSIQEGLPGSMLYAFPSDKVIGGSVSHDEVNLWGLSLERGNEGELLFQNTWDAPSEWAAGNITVTGFQAGWCAWSNEEDVAVLWAKELATHYAFCLETGEFLWTTEPQRFLDAWDDTVTLRFGPSRSIAYGHLYTVSIAGTVYAFDIETGETKWTYDVEDYWHEVLWANNWWSIITFVSDGTIYLGHIEHSPIDPKPRGAPFIALDALTGDEVFRADGLFRQSRWGGRAIIADSVIVTQDTYDQRIYAIGKGPSHLTVKAPDTAQHLGMPVMIQGSVKDVSPGTQDTSIQLRFPDGVPAVGDESMAEWMKHVYKQFSKPDDVVGVPVTLEAIDPDGNRFHIVGQTYTDENGNFAYTFTPETTGQYKIIATFEGTESYYGYQSTTYMTVGPSAPQPAPPTDEPTPTPPPTDEPTPTPTPPTDEVPPPDAPAPMTWYIVIAAVVVVAAVAATAIFLRQRK